MHWKYRANFQCFISQKQKDFYYKKKIVLNFYLSSPTTDYFDMHFEDTYIYKNKILSRYTNGHIEATENCLVVTRILMNK
jgi:hypothetical protein